MPGSFELKLNPAGIAAMLAEPEVQAMLMARAERVADAARSRGIDVERGKDIPLPIEVRAAGNADRARAVVAIAHPSGLAVEAKHRLLGSSLDAAR